jgi:hypothetical protein
MPQMALSGDEHPDGAFAAHATDPTLSDRVGRRRPHRRGDDLGADGGEHRIERRGELGVPVPDQEFQIVSAPVEVHEPVASLLTEAWFWEDDPRDTSEIEPRVEAVYRHGSVVLGTGDGPTHRLLIVSGPQRGRIWLISEVGAMPCPEPAGAEQDGSTFLDWIKQWHEAPDTWGLDL